MPLGRAVDMTEGPFRSNDRCTGLQISAVYLKAIEGRGKVW